MSKRKFAGFLLVIMLLIMLAGMALMFFAGVIGLQSASVLTRWVTGTEDINIFNMLAGTISTSCQYAGRIVMLIGGLGFLIGCAALFIAKPTQPGKREKRNHAEMG